MKKPKFQKTLTIPINKKFNKIFTVLCTNSRYVYNTCIFTNKIFNLFKSQVFSEVLAYFKNETLEEDKLMKDIFASIFYKYFLQYVKILQTVKDNNSIIYKYIKKFITDNKIIINSKNYEQYKKLFVENLDKKVKYNENNKFVAFTHIVDNILKSFYYSNFFTVKRQITGHLKLTIKDKQLIKDVKNNFQFKFGCDVSDIKKNIQYILDVSFKKELAKINKPTKDQTDKIKKKFKCVSEQYLFQYSICINNINKCNDVLPPDITQHIIDKYHESLTSYHGLLAKGIYAQKPKFKNKDVLCNLYYYPCSFKIVNRNIRFNIGKYFEDKFSEYTNYIKHKKNFYYSTENITKNGKGKSKSKQYVKISKNKYVLKENLIKSNYAFIRYPKLLVNKQIKLCTIKHEKTGFKVKVTYEDIKPSKLNKTVNEKSSISIDLGMKNLMTIYDPTGSQKIIKGSYINSLNEFYNKKISGLQQVNNKMKKTSFSRLNSLHEERQNKMTGYINKLILKLKTMYRNKKTMIVGYNEGWKQNVNLGRTTNRKFMSIPFYLIIRKMTEQMRQIGVNVMTIEESYTSKCDSLQLEKVGKHDKYSGKRKKRGLFISGCKKGINADLNGAINIMRKMIPLKKINGKKIYNPQCIKI